MVVNGRKRAKQIRNLGVVALAERYGWSVPHVSMVLSGDRTSAKVLAAAAASGLITTLPKRVVK